MATSISFKKKFNEMLRITMPTASTVPLSKSKFGMFHMTMRLKHM
jgi:hypothetical protein